MAFDSTDQRKLNPPPATGGAKEQMPFLPLGSVSWEGRAHHVVTRSSGRKGDEWWDGCRNEEGGGRRAKPWLF